MEKYDKYTCEVSNPQLRRDYIGASDAAAIMRVSPWDTQLSLWQTKVGLRPPKDLSAAMARGISLEEKARQTLNKLKGVNFKPFRVFSPVHKFMMASMDGITENGYESVEIKCPGRTDHECAVAGVIPEKYYPQLQHQMVVTGHSAMYYFSYYSDDDYVLMPISANKEYQEKLIAKEEAFYLKVQNFIEPEYCERDYTMRSDAAWRDASQKYIYTKKMIENLEKTLEYLRKDLIDLSEGKSCKGCGIQLSSSIRKGRILYNEIPELRDIDVDKYRDGAKPVVTISIKE